MLSAYVHDGLLCNALYLDSVLPYMLVLSYVVVVIKRVSYQGRLRGVKLVSVKKHLMELLGLYIHNTRRKELEAPVKTDHGLYIHVRSFQSSSSRESVRQNREKRNKPKSAVVMREGRLKIEPDMVCKKGESLT